MKKTRIGILVAAALCIFPPTAWAQEKAGKDAKEEAGKVVDVDADAEQGEAGEGAEPAGDDEEVEDISGSDLGDICKIDPAACPSLDMKKEAARQLDEQIYAVQQLFALRVRRFELQPYWSLTLNDQFVSHPAPGAALNYYITNVLAIGANFNFYRPFNVDSKFNAQVRRAARVSVPLTEYDWGAGLNFTYVPAYGKFAGFQDFIFHYDAYVVGGVGALSTRPIAVIDPDNRNFDYKPKIDFNVGLGVRIFLNRWFGVTLEVRDYIYNEQLEALTVAPSGANGCTKCAQDADTWFGENRLTNNVQMQLGVSIFLPFSWEYRLPK